MQINSTGKKASYAYYDTHFGKIIFIMNKIYSSHYLPKCK